MQKLFFPGPQRVELCGILTDPAAQKPGPIWILVHGSSSSKESVSITKLARILDEKGTASFRIDLYGHGESGGDFAKATVSRAAASVLAAITFLKTRGYKKIGLMGTSYGGSAAIIAASKSKDLFALALKSPVSDHRMILGRGPTGGPEDVWLNKDFIKDALKNDGYRAIKKVTIPVLVVHGDKDEDVPLAQSRRLAAAAKNVKLVVVPGADHRYTKPLHTKKMLALLSNFMLQEGKKNSGGS